MFKSVLFLFLGAVLGLFLQPLIARADAPPKRSSSGISSGSAILKQPALQLGSVELLFPQDSSTSGVDFTFPVPFKTNPLVSLSVNSQSNLPGSVSPNMETFDSMPELDYFWDKETVYIVASLDTPVAVDTIFTVVVTAGLPGVIVWTEQ